ncbi:hypothetical protein HD806DRAFT_505978 [Xylariaceae sp. AK1471]|nr:hypothetical protein HD806DRAFT_505978 [Xylariaceae sp. AK1471]
MADPNNNNPSSLVSEANFEFSDEIEIDTLLGIRNESRVNRPLATQEHIGKTSYSAYVNHIQYGTFSGRPACLLGLDFSFRFPSLSAGRFSSAEIEVTFEKALNTSKPSLRSTDASLDPIVANFAPKHMIGQVKERESSRALELEIPVTFGVPFGSVGLTASWSKTTSFTEEGRLEILGNLAQDDEHDEGANSVQWDLNENKVSKEGIIRSFRGVVLLYHQPQEAFWMRVSVKPVVKFSLDPRRLLTKRLVGDKDDPVLLDGYTERGEARCLANRSFDSADFPWHIILDLPKSIGESSV